MATDVPQATMFQTVAMSLSPDLIKELKDAKSYSIEQKESLLGLAKKLLAECDDVDEDICVAVDYLQCQVEHNANQANIMNVIRHRDRFEGEFGEVRYLFRDLRDKLMESIRYGKRTEEVDQLLMKLSTLIAMVNQMSIPQPVVNFANVEGLLSPRCNTCTEACRSSFRKVQVFIRKVIQACEQNNSKPKPKRKNEASSKDS